MASLGKNNSYPLIQILKKGYSMIKIYYLFKVSTITLIHVCFNPQYNTSCEESSLVFLQGQQNRINISVTHSLYK